MRRNRPPWRRPCITETRDFKGENFAVCVGFNPETLDPCEVFIDGPPRHTGNVLDRESDDAAILMSVQLQLGRSPEQIASSLSTEPDYSTGREIQAPASIASFLARAITEMQVKKE